MPASNKVYDMGLGVYPICIQIEYIMYIILNSKDEFIISGESMRFIKNIEYDDGMD